jgi:hypothetical protein
MNKVIKEFLVNKKVRNSTSLLSLIATFLTAGVPWGSIS